MDEPPSIRYFAPSGALIVDTQFDDRICEFEYTEIFLSGEVYHGFSCGGGDYYDHPRAATQAFHVRKDRRRQSLSLHLKSASLQRLFSDSHITHRLPPRICNDCAGAFSVWDITPQYPYLKRKLFAVQNPFVNNYGDRALALFLRDFLCDHAIFDGLDLEGMLANDIISPSHWQDIQHYKALKELRQVSTLFDGVSPLESPDSPVSEPQDLYLPAPIQRPRFLGADVQGMLRRAARKGDILLARSILRENGAAGGSVGRISESCLTLAIQTGHMDIFWLYLNHGASVNSRCDPLWNEPLYTAAKYGYLDAVKALLTQGAKLDGNLYGGCFKSPLTGAASGGFLHIVRFLVECGAIIDEVNHYTPLAAAAKHNHVDILEYLLDHRANIDAGSGTTPLIAAIKAGNSDIVRLLINRGANVNQSYFPDHPKNPVARRLSDAHSVIEFEQIAHSCVDRRTPLFFAIITGRVEIADILIAHGAKVTEQELVISENLAHMPPATSAVPVTEADVQCTFSHAIKARQRHRLLQRLRKAILQNQALICDMAAGPTASDELKRFAKGFENSRSNWKMGLGVLKDLLNNQPPTELKQVFGCLQALDAMRQSVGLEYLDKEFFIDLRRWRMILPASEGPLFDEILLFLWNVDCSSSQPVPLPPNDALLYFQRLVTNLIWKGDISHLLELSFDSGGRKLDEIGHEYAPSDSSDFFAENTLLLPSKHEQENKLHERDPPILQHWEPASSTVVYLMATAVFTTFIIFLLAFKTVLPASTLASFFRDTEDGPAPLSRYAMVLFVYLGLNHQQNPGQYSEEVSTNFETSSGTASIAEPALEFMLTEGGFSEHADEDFTDADGASSASVSSPNPRRGGGGAQSKEASESSSRKSPGAVLQCPQCQKMFKTVGNRNKHLKTNCRFGAQRKLQCRNKGCTRMLKGDWYLRIHEQERCRFKSTR